MKEHLLESSEKKRREGEKAEIVTYVLLYFYCSYPFLSLILFRNKRSYYEASKQLNHFLYFSFDTSDFYLNIQSFVCILSIFKSSERCFNSEIPLPLCNANGIFLTKVIKKCFM